MKRFFKGFVAVALSTVFISTSISQVTAQRENNPTALTGVVYDGVINEIASKASLNARLTINELVVKNDQVFFNGTIKNGSTESSIRSAGEVFQPQNLFLQKANGLTLIMEPVSNYELLSFTIEETANKALLLPVNGNLANETVIKLAIREKGSNKIYYFEDLLPAEIDLNQIRSIAKSASEKEQSFNNASTEAWFTPFLDRKYNQPKQIQDEQSMLTNFTVTATSPVVGVPDYMFTVAGPATITSNDAYGYYVDTVEWPIGSGHMLTSLVKWSWISNDPGPIQSTQLTSTGVTALQIVTEGQYYYDATYDDIYAYDNRSFLRIRNQLIEAGIADGNTEIISRIERDGTVNDTSSSVNWWDLIGLLPFGNTFSSAATFFGAISYLTETRTTSTINYHDNVSDNELTYGDSLRNYKLRSNGDYLGTEGDEITFTYTVRVPGDKTRNTGSHGLFYKYNFDVYSRNGFMVYTVLNTSVDKYISGSY